MLRLRLRDADELPEPPPVRTPWKVMTTTEPAPQASETIEVHKPGSPHEVVRIGPTVTQVAGFGPQAEVVAWLADALPIPPLVIGADAFDELNDSRRHADHLEPAERDTLVDRVLDLAARAREIEDSLAAMGHACDPVGAQELAGAAGSLAVEWDAFAETVRDGQAESRSREIDLRARTAEILGHLSGPAPAAELRAYAGELLARHPTPDRAVALRSELDRIEAEGRDMVARIDAADGVALPAVRIQELFGDENRPVVLDGDLLYAVAPAVHDLLLDKLRTETDRRRVIIVFDDTLDAWLATVHGATLWSTGHLHLVPKQAEDPAGAEAAQERASRAGARGAGRVSKTLTQCTRHPAQLTRLSCGACERPFCSSCLVRVNTKRAMVLCMECALERGTGVKRRGR